MIRNVEDNMSLKDIYGLYRVAGSWCVEDEIKSLTLTS